MSKDESIYTQKKVRCPGSDRIGTVIWEYAQPPNSCGGGLTVMVMWGEKEFTKHHVLDLEFVDGPPTLQHAAIPPSRVNGPFRYVPTGDCDGELIGTDHYVIDAAENQIACAPNEATARILAVSSSLVEVLEEFFHINSVHGYEFDSNEPELFGKMKALVAFTKERTT